VHLVVFFKGGVLREGILGIGHDFMAGFDVNAKREREREREMGSVFRVCCSDCVCLLLASVQWLGLCVVWLPGGHARDICEIVIGEGGGKNKQLWSRTVSACGAPMDGLKRIFTQMSAETHSGMMHTPNSSHFAWATLDVTAVALYRIEPIRPLDRGT
jgi:hypothetical protein